ncbi:MAG: sigma-70 family RNA polymerase sigma factor [Oscillospiraceae bacterium]|nr:sigma-70 family RNA polymerase sigma factor [Oscillospiraceae bacterium]
MSVTLYPKENPTGTEDVNQYLQEIGRYPRLSYEQERELAKRCAQGDEEAIKTMVNANLRLVVSVAREYAGRGVPLLDLVQEGSIGLLAAARKFDYTLDYRFSTYATKWIRQGISRCIMNHAGMIRVPQYTAERMRKLLAARAELTNRTGQQPTPECLAAHTGIPEDKVQQLLQLLPEVYSLDAPTGEDATLGLLIEDLEAPQPQEELVRRELKRTLEELMGMLTERQQLTLRLHYGMADGVCYSLEQISKVLGVSKERTRQIERQAMEKLKKLGVDFGLEDYLE